MSEKKLDQWMTLAKFRNDNYKWWSTGLHDNKDDAIASVAEHVRKHAAPCRAIRLADVLALAYVESEMSITTTEHDALLAQLDKGES